MKLIYKYTVYLPFVLFFLLAFLVHTYGLSPLIGDAQGQQSQMNKNIDELENLGGKHIKPKKVTTQTLVVTGNTYVVAKLSSNEGNFATGAYQQVHLNAVISDNNNEFSVSTSSFVAKMDGHYLILGQVDSDLDDADSGIVAIYVNSTMEARSYTTQGGGSEVILQAYHIRKLNAGDTVSLYFYHNHGSNRTVYTGTNYQATLLTIIRLF